MHLPTILIVFFFYFYQTVKSVEYQDDQKECTCECCLDDSENCTPTFRSAINLNPLLDCNNVTCKQELCLTFSQCSTAFGYFILFFCCKFNYFQFRKTEAICTDINTVSSAIVKTTFRSSYAIIILEIITISLS